MSKIRKMLNACYLAGWLLCRNVVFLLQTFLKKGPIAFCREIYRTGVWISESARIIWQFRSLDRRFRFLQLSLTRFPDAILLNKLVGDCFFRALRYEDAVYSYGKAMRLGDKGAASRRGLVAALGQIECHNHKCIEFAVTTLERLYQRNMTCAEITYDLGVALLCAQRFEALVELTNPLLNRDGNRPECLALRGLAYQHLGQYELAIADFDRAAQLDPVLVRNKQLNLNRAYLRGLRADVVSAFSALRDHFQIPKSDCGNAKLAEQIIGSLQSDICGTNLQESVGVFFGVFQKALGHAVLDPFHFYNLFADRFDRLVMITPPRHTFEPATSIPLKILEQYVDIVECTKPDILNLSWQNLGPLTHKNITLLIHNYWGLNRMAFKARSEASHPMRTRRQYFRLPPKIVNQSERLCKRMGIDLRRRTVVLHSREHTYHNLRGQSYRNTEIRNYIPAISRLIDDGYQVIRIGDKKMTSIKDLAKGIIELPGMDSYNPILDPFLISRCRFMISCQSGPCSYARIFGKPNLVVNAVYHFTLIPEAHELIGFKNYVDLRTREPLSLEEIMRSGCHLFDRTEHFTDHGIEVIDMTSDEILAAVDEMIAWRDNPTQLESASQEKFRELMQWHMMNPNETHILQSPMSDYIGYALPECRLSDTVTRLRPGYFRFQPMPVIAGRDGYRVAI